MTTVTVPTLFSRDNNNLNNADTAKSVGENILSSMNGKCATDYSFKRSAQAVTMVSKSSVKIDNYHVQVDPQLLCQRLIIACDNSNQKNCFDTSFAHILLLFSTSLLLLGSHKSQH